jgi:hypothetical protein
MEMTTVWTTMSTTTRILEENRSEPEEEEQQQQEEPFQQDHVEVTDFLHLLNRSVTPPLPPDSD